MKKAFFYAAALAALTSLNFVLTARARNTLPITAQIRLSRGLSAEDYFDLKKRFGLNGAALAQSDGRIKAGAAEAEVRLAFTESDFWRLSGLLTRGMASGAFFPPVCERLAVIGEDLALELFMSNGVIGAVVEIGGGLYTICGVYKNDKTLLGSLSEDGARTVYLPLAGALAANAAVRDIFLGPASDLNLQDALSALSAEGIAVGKVANYPETLGLLRQNVKLQRFFIFAGAAFCLCAFAARKAARLVCMARETRKSREARIVTARAALRAAGRILTAAALFAISVVLIKTGCFTPYLPQGILTAAGRIDFTHMFYLFINETRQTNNGGDFWARYALRAMLWSLAACAGSLAAALKLAACVLRAANPFAVRP